ncbi:DUF6093 family protein [Specibacter sp. NPDC078692]|uniref:DUF6093 family protein n=1 Tax=Specibacter sp. NPDC078692 TaxID=3155818 RepID=UPI003437C081
MELFDPDDIDEAREDAESVMFDTCVIDRPGVPVTDAAGVVTTPKTRVYPTPAEIADGNPGRCKVQQTIAQGGGPVAGGHVFIVQDGRLDLPVSAGPFAVDDVATLTSSLKTPHLVGNIYRMAEVYEKSYPSAQRIRVKQVTA